MVNSDSSGNPTSIAEVSNQPVLDQDNATAGPNNLFLDTFFIQTSGPNTGGLGTFEGGPQIVGSSAHWANAYFTVLSPLYYSDGTGAAAVPAAAGTYLNFYDLFPNNSDGNHPGASNGNFNLTGTASSPGFGISLDDFHEVQKNLILGPGSTQTNGEYGYAFDVTIPFTNGSTFTTGSLVDVFATGTTSDQNDPLNTGFGLVSDSQQDAATSQVYDAVIAAVPEPSTTALAAAGAVLLGLARLRRFLTRR
ncbi:MAG: PEP-CTERM sorting domain-containing protein [Thermoguttaceae bacterium]